jgi:hypothetical protein
MPCTPPLPFGSINSIVLPGHTLATLPITVDLSSNSPNQQYDYWAQPPSSAQKSATPMDNSSGIIIVDPPYPPGDKKEKRPELESVGTD